MASEAANCSTEREIEEMQFVWIKIMEKPNNSNPIPCIYFLYIKSLSKILNYLESHVTRNPAYITPMQDQDLSTVELELIDQDSGLAKDTLPFGPFLMSCFVSNYILYMPKCDIRYRIRIIYF